MKQILILILLLLTGGCTPQSPPHTGVVIQKLQSEAKIIPEWHYLGGDRRTPAYFPEAFMIIVQEDNTNYLRKWPVQKAQWDKYEVGMRVTWQTR